MKNIMKKFYMVLFLLVLSNTAVFAESVYVVASPSLNLRSDASTKAKVLVSIPFNAKVTLLELKDNEITLGGLEGKWAKVSYKGKTGWVFNPYLAPRPLDTKFWTQVSKLNAKARKAKSDDEIHDLFTETMQLLNPQGSFRKSLNKLMELAYEEIYGEENYRYEYNYYYMMNKTLPIAPSFGEDFSFVNINARFFKSKAKKGTVYFDFFSLCENGFIDVYGVQGVPYTAWMPAAYDYPYQVNEAKKSLSQWKKILPKLNGSFKKVALNTINELEKILKECKQNPSGCE